MNEIINSMSVHTASLEELKDMVTEIKSLKEENQGEKTENKKRLEEVKHKADNLKGRSRQNIIIYDILNTGDRLEMWEQCDSAVKDAFKEKVKIDGNISLDRKHRLNPEN